MTSIIRIGLGCTLIERAMNGGHLDGIGIYAKNLRESLSSSQNVEVLPICFPPKPWEQKLSETLRGSMRFSCAYGASAALSAVTSLPFPGAGKIARRVDVYHATDHLIPKIKGIPVVATICDALSVKKPEWINSGFAQFRSSLVRASASWADHVIAISEAMVPDLVEHFGVPQKNISVVHLGIGKDWLEPVPEADKDAVMEKYGLVRGYFLFVGTLQPRKNVESIVAAYKLLPHTLQSERHLVIAGQPGWGSAPLLKQIYALQQDRKCSWLQYVAAEDLRALYQCAGVFVFPSLWEGFGIPVLEAYASGVPVITSNLSSLPEVAGQAAVLIDPYSVPDLREAMVCLAGNSELAASLVKKGRVRAAAMSWDNCAAKTLDVYKKVL